jgi:CubicO group peptidase (beta-lactamase class C family)
MRRIAAAFALVLVCSVRGVGAQPASPAPPAGDSIAAAVDAAAAKIVAQGHVPGLAIAVERAGRVVLERGYGVADVATKSPVTPQTHFEIGSITKQFTAACILQLAEAGKLSLDDHLGTYVSDYFVGRGVTIRQLLEHQSGIPEYLDGPDVVSDAGSKPATYASILARVSAKPLDFAPGTRWKYSNTNYVLLGRVIEVAAKMPYEQYVRAHVFEPAGMTQSGFIADEKTLVPMATGYRGTLRGAEKAPPLRDDWAWSAGAIVSTVGDLLKWDDALLAGKIVSPADVAAMRANAPLADGKPSGYGYGWITDALDGHPRVWHNGETFGFYALNETFPADGEAIVVLSNATLPAADTLVQTAFAATHADVTAPEAVVTPAPGEDKAITSRALDTLRQIESGDVDRSRLTEKMSAALTPELLAGVKEQFAPIGMPQSVVFTGKRTLDDGETVYTYRATFATISLNIIMSLDAQGKIAGYLLRPL